MLPKSTEDPDFAFSFLTFRQETGINLSTHKPGQTDALCSCLVDSLSLKIVILEVAGLFATFKIMQTSGTLTRRLI